MGKLSAGSLSQPVRTADTSAKIRVAIVDDHPVFRLGLRSLLGTVDGLEVVALAEGGEAALEILVSTQIDVFLVDLRMPALSGVQLIQRMRELDRKVRILVISCYQGEEEIYAVVKAGAQGFVHKTADPDDILKATLQVAQGKRAFPRHLSERLESADMSAGLSAREQEVLQLVATGLTNKEVALALNITVFTARNHLNQINRKLEATDRTEAIFIALRTGLIFIA